MVILKLESFRLIGLALKDKTSNENGQSALDCGKHWETFRDGGFAGRIFSDSDPNIYAVYYNYEGDYTKPFSYFLGCKVDSSSPVPAGMDSLNIPANTYQIITAAGKMPDCIAWAWRNIWQSDIPRSYGFDFELYDKKSKDWSKAEINIYLSVK